MTTTHTANASASAPAKIQPADTPVPVKSLNAMESNPIHTRHVPASRTRMLEGRNEVFNGR